jgi:hypothetical protein
MHEPRLTESVRNDGRNHAEPVSESLLLVLRGSQNVFSGHPNSAEQQSAVAVSHVRGVVCDPQVIQSCRTTLSSDL